MDPELAAIAAFLPRPDLSDPLASRRQISEMIALGAPHRDQAWRERVDVESREILGPDGNTVRVRIYTPRFGPRPAPALVHFHGGAFTVGDLELSENPVSQYADRAGVTVVDVDYRLAPEQPFPAGFDDCYAALRWTVEHSTELGIDAQQVAVGGSSAGGGLAAAVALAARDRGGPAIAYQLLLYPVLDDRMTTRSVQEMTDTPMWNAECTVQMWQHYLGGTADSETVSPYAAPARAVDTDEGLAGLPPAYILACELDPLRDEDIAYAVDLIAAGVSVDLRVVAGAYHGFDEIPTAISRRVFAEVVAALRLAMGG